MPGPTTEVLNSDLKELRADLSSLRSDFAEFRGEARVMFRLIAGIGGALLVTAVLGLISGVWWASSVTSDVRTLKADVAGLRSGPAPKQP